MGVSANETARQQPQYARIYETGDSIILYCAYCAVKLHNGNAVIKTWTADRADMQEIYEQRAEHDRLYHPVRWWNRH
jgi:hypothetical protein